VFLFVYELNLVAARGLTPILNIKLIAWKLDGSACEVVGWEGPVSHSVWETFRCNAKQNDDAWEEVKRRAWAHWSFSTLSIRHAHLTAHRQTLHSFIQLSSTTLTWHVGADPVPRIQSMNHSVIMNKLFQLSSTMTSTLHHFHHKKNIQY